MKFMYKGGVGVKVEDCDVQSMCDDGYAHHPGGPEPISEPKVFEYEGALGSDAALDAVPDTTEKDIEDTFSKEKTRPRRGRPRKNPEAETTE